VIPEPAIPEVLTTAAALSGLAAMWLGLALCLNVTPWARRRTLQRRLAPHVRRGSRSTSGPTTARRWGSATAVLSPPVLAALDGLSRALGARDDLRTRLSRADDRRDPTSFRIQQLAGCALAACVGAAAAVATRSTLLAGVVLLVGTPATWLLVSERSLDRRIAQQQERVRLELPVAAEQLGILIGAGYSLAAALQRLAERGRGRTASELALVCRNLRQGVPEATALANWDHRCGVDAVSRLVRVLAMHRDAGDLGRLITAEARATRAETHRVLVQLIEQRSQLVWIPVTVATLVPGLLLLAIPFISALQQVSG